MVSPEFYKSPVCKKEIVAASKRAFMDSKFTIITTVFGKLPENVVRFERGWFGESKEDLEGASVVKEERGQLLPRPSDGIFTDNYDVHFYVLRQRLRDAGVNV